MFSVFFGFPQHVPVQCALNDGHQRNGSHLCKAFYYIRAGFAAQGLRRDVEQLRKLHRIRLLVLIELHFHGGIRDFLEAEALVQHNKGLFICVGVHALKFCAQIVDLPLLQTLFGLQEPSLIAASGRHVAFQHQCKVHGLDQLTVFLRDRHPFGAVLRVSEDLQEVVRIVGNPVDGDIEVLEDGICVLQDGNIRLVNVMDAAELSEVAPIDVGIPALAEIVVPDHGPPELVCVQRVASIIIQQKYTGIIGDGNGLSALIAV